MAENFTYSYTIIDGDALMGTLETISNEVKILPSPDGAPSAKQQHVTNTKGDIEITEEKLRVAKKRLSYVRGR